MAPVFWAEAAAEVLGPEVAESPLARRLLGAWRKTQEVTGTLLEKKRTIAALVPLTSMRSQAERAEPRVALLI